MQDQIVVECIHMPTLVQYALLSSALNAIAAGRDTDAILHQLVRDHLRAVALKKLPVNLYHKTTLLNHIKKQPPYD